MRNAEKLEFVGVTGDAALVGRQGGKSVTARQPSSGERPSVLIYRR